jgi:ATP-dependent protease ClpP protease subunit
MICGDIDEYYAGKITTRAHTLSETKEDIQILITSYGGELYPGGAIIRAIRHAQDKGCAVIGEVRGYAMSMAAIILQSCDVRFASLEDIIMVHGVTSVAEGSIRNQEADVNMAKKLMDVHADILANRNTSEDEQYHDKKYWRKLLDDNYPHYYFGEEALKIGLIDEVIKL